MFWLWLTNLSPQDLQNIIDWIRHEALKGDWVIKIRSFNLSIRGDQLKEWDDVKFLAKVVEIIEKLFDDIDKMLIRHNNTWELMHIKA